MGVKIQQINISKSIFHLTKACIAKPAPATAPTIEWLVEIGIFQYVAKTTQAQAAKLATSAKYKDKFLSSSSIGTMPLPMVLAT